MLQRLPGINITNINTFSSNNKIYGVFKGNAVYLHRMKIEEAIVYLLASSGHGMKTEQIAREINHRGLCARADGGPITDKQVYAVIMKHPETFVKSEGRIRLMI